MINSSQYDNKYLYRSSLICIFAYLNEVTDFVNCSKVCKAWNQASHDRLLREFMVARFNEQRLLCIPDSDFLESVTLCSWNKVTKWRNDTHGSPVVNTLKAAAAEVGYLGLSVLGLVETTGRLAIAQSAYSIPLVVARFLHFFEAKDAAETVWNACQPVARDLTHQADQTLIGTAEVFASLGTNFMSAEKVESIARKVERKVSGSTEKIVEKEAVIWIARLMGGAVTNSQMSMVVAQLEFEKNLK